MPSAVKLREDYSAEELRALTRRPKDARQSRRLLSLAAVRDGMDRGEAAKVGGMDRQTLRDWFHRFNAMGPDGLLDNWTSGPKPRLLPDQFVASEAAGIAEGAVIERVKRDPAIAIDPHILHGGLIYEVVGRARLAEVHGGYARAARASSS